MARRIFQQPDGLFAEYSTVVDMFIGTNWTEEDVIENAVLESAEQARIDTKRAIEAAKRGPLYGLLYKEAVKNHNQRSEHKIKIGDSKEDN